MDCKATVQSAQRLGLSVPAYVARLWEDEGTVEEFVQYLAARIPLSECRRILEIGTGTGRFLEPVAQIAKPVSYDVFEASVEWSAYLARTFPFTTVHEADGRSLAGIPDNSQNLVHAHGVFVYLSASASSGYFFEMARVCAPGGYLVFDCFLADRQTVESIETWRANGVGWQVLLPRAVICDLFARQDIALVDSEYRKKTYLSGFSDYLVFQKAG
jgi:SAM-dependent methyltransferase